MLVKKIKIKGGLPLKNTENFLIIQNNTRGYANIENMSYFLAIQNNAINLVLWIYTTHYVGSNFKFVDLKESEKCDNGSKRKACKTKKHI